MAISFDEIRNMPKALPKGLLEWIRKEQLPDDNILLYDRKHPKRGYCYLCGKHVELPRDRFRQGEKRGCPNCGNSVWIYLSDGFYFSTNYINNVATLQRGRDGAVWIREWHIKRGPERGITKDNLQPTDAWLIKGTEVFKWAMEEKLQWTAMSFQRYVHDDWFKSKRIVYTVDGFYAFYLPDDWRDIVKDTPLRYLDLEDAVRHIKTTNVLRLMLDWARYPAIEKLLKAGFTSLVEDRLRGADKFRSIKWKQKDIKAALGFPLRLADQMCPRHQLSLAEAEFLKFAWQMVEAKTIKESEIPLLLKLSNVDRAKNIYSRPVPNVNRLKTLQPVFGHANFAKIYRHLKALSWRDLDMYRDYIRDCAKLGFNLDDEHILFPRNLHNAHQRTIKLIKYEAAKENEEKFAKIAAGLKKLSYALGPYLIRPAESERELIDEGEALIHCVASYAPGIVAGSTSIFFIRKAETPDIPFYTLEYREGRVVQCRTYENHTYMTDPEIVAFVEEWLVHIGGKKKKEAAA